MKTKSFFPIGCLVALALFARAVEAEPTAIEWQTLRARFKLSFNLDPPAPAWAPGGPGQPLAGEYRAGDYRLAMSEEKLGGQERVVRYQLRRSEGRPFKVADCRIDCKTSYAGVYKMFSPMTLAQQSYKLDLPFSLTGSCNGLSDQPVIWMQQTDGRNTLTFGMMNQLPLTALEGSTYDESNGGESPGIANSYVRATVRRTGAGAAVTNYSDGLYINANPSIAWDRALLAYAAAVDRAREFHSRPIGADAMNPMWHSWYAHGSDINQAQLLDDARRAAALGVKTIEIDAGWNMVGYDLDREGGYDFEPGRFPNPKKMIDDMHRLGLKVVLHVAPLVMGKNARPYAEMKDCLVKLGGKEDQHLDPRYRKAQAYLLKMWTKLFSEYGVNGLWCDFLEVPPGDAPPAGADLISPDLYEAYTLLMQSLYQRALELDPDALIILRRATANLNAKTFCTHVWPMDTPQDYNMNRRDVVFMKTYGPGVLTHACSTSWAISESDENVARQMASVVMAGVPAFSVKLAESPKSHNEIIAAWIKFYEASKNELMLGQVTPLLPTPPSAVLRCEGGKESFFGFFEAAPGLLKLTRPVDKITLVNAFSPRTFARIEGVANGRYQAGVFDQAWKPVSHTILKASQGGLDLDFTGPSGCYSIVLTRLH